MSESRPRAVESTDRRWRARPSRYPIRQNRPRPLIPDATSKLRLECAECSTDAHGDCRELVLRASLLLAVPGLWRVLGRAG